jgi:hypothetical protein
MPSSVAPGVGLMIASKAFPTVETNAHSAYSGRLWTSAATVSVEPPGVSALWRALVFQEGRSGQVRSTRGPGTVTATCLARKTSSRSQLSVE